VIARIFRVFAVVILVLALLVFTVFAGARFHDGPIALIPGGPLEAGELVAAPVTDWAFAGPPKEIELQLADESTSRTTWIIVREGAAFIPASLTFPPGKRWHKAADQNGAAWVRIEGKRYPVQLTRISDPTLEGSLREAAVAKYPEAGSSEGGVWFFQVASRAG
jgi:hypothetical protein